ncbi:MAG TPA: RHS repeat-associated core domain-containing protein [Ktedonobacterales bacterium]|nr:RHS repeat-associated core domain-containing protein [Ktedonobacterales bacterium]
MRCSSGTMPTAKGFTGQRADAATGLDYYGARYYDAVAGQFTSADTVASGLSPYAYVKGNPETLTDPTGHRLCNPNNPDQCAPPPGHSGSGTGSNGGSPTSSSSGRDSHGKCTLISICDQDKAAAFNALKGEYEKDLAFAAGFDFVALLLRAFADKTNPLAELMDGILFIQAYIAGAPALVGYLFGEDSGFAKMVSESVHLLAQTLMVLQGIQASVSALLAIGMFASLVPAISNAIGIIFTVATGPVGVFQEALSVAATAVAYGSQAASSWYLDQANGVLDQMFAIGGETTQQWCQRNRGACGQVANWNA